MVWFDNISQLQYYNQPKGVPCYCEIIVFPSDMILQAQFPANSGAFGLLIEVMSVDGLIVYEDATAYFDRYFFIHPTTGDYVANLQLKSFSPQMCARVCYILRVRIDMGTTRVFDKYTERYCQSSCCDIARDITFEQEGIVLTGGGDGSTPTSYPKYSECGEAIITLRSNFVCVDNFTGDVYGTPTDMLFGSATFQFQKITNMRGRIVQRPREITREYSYNCRLQRAESKIPFLLEGFEYFPTWKMSEIEGQLHANELYVEDIPYEYAGGTPFKQIWNCDEVFKLKTTLENCTIRQIFGCTTGCATKNYDGANAMYILPMNADTTTYRDENGVIVATSYADLLLYFRGLDGVSDVSDIDVSGLDCGVYKAFSITGNGYIPTSFYYDEAMPQNRIFSKVLASEDDICGEYGATCVMPVIGTVLVEDQPCVAPVIGTVAVEDIVPTEITVVGVGDWEIVDSGTDITLFNGFVTMNLEVTNATIFESPDNPGDPVQVYGTIALIGEAGRPAQPMILDENNSTLAAGNILVINPDGTVVYTGLTTTASDINVSIDFDTIIYSV